MVAGAILHEVTHATGLPRRALQAASAQGVELLPKFLGIIEGHLDQEPPARASPTPLFFIFHLLGEWRESTAYRPLALLLRYPADEADAIFGDATTSPATGLWPRSLTAILSRSSTLFSIPVSMSSIRSRMCEALAMITLRGQLDRDLAARFLRDAFNELQPQRRCFIWAGWQSAIAVLGLSELKVLVKRAFDRGFIDPTFRRFADFENDLRRGLKQPGEPLVPDDNEFELFGDTVEELCRWHCFTERDDEDKEEGSLPSSTAS
jgi:Protein of unknown function (DUF1186)